MRVEWTYPNFPRIVKAEFVCPYTNHAPSIEQDYSNGDGVKHGFGSQSEALLNRPERVDTNRLRKIY